MSDAKPTRPHLVAIGDSSNEPSVAPPAADRASEPAGRGVLFWLLVALVVAASAGLVVQMQRAGELQGTVAELEGELFTTRTALDAYEVRFDEVRDSVGSLQAQLEQLNALVNADPLAEPAAADAATEAAVSSESGHPAGPSDLAGD
ncbi:MAG: hypothetical protein JRG90_09860 [Deltaproteobacteria bacterium]|nr:hypothetical protein [Deltaproteobacteria bacterium]MBW2665165.1 hypothetical protein [Deltaproteobacteria bacterium]